MAKLMIYILVLVGATVSMVAEAGKVEDSISCLSDASKHLAAAGLPKDVAEWVETLPIKPEDVVKNYYGFLSTDIGLPDGYPAEGCDQLTDAARTLLMELPCMHEQWPLNDVSQAHLKPIFLADKNLQTLYIGSKACYDVGLHSMRPIKG